MKIDKIGLQLYSIKDFMKDEVSIKESFKKIKSFGYDVIQTAGCAIPYADYGRIAREEGLEICGSHENIRIMVNDPDEAIKNHRELGTKIIGTGGWIPGEYTVEKVEKYIGRFNNFASAIAKEGFHFTYHNHSDEFRYLENGKTMMDMLFEKLDPINASFCLDTYWVQHAGADVRHWIEKLKGRIVILHLKDFIGTNSTTEITEIGNGHIWWEGVLESAVNAGVKYYIVEHDHPQDPFKSVKISADYIHKNFM